MRSRSILLLSVAALLLSAPGANARDALKSFVTPSGNIACQLSSLDGVSGVRCDIRVHAWHVRRAKRCHLAYGDSLGVGTTGRAGFICHGDTVFGGNPTLAYGHSESLGVFTCSSATTGVTCLDTRTRHGFFISRQTYRIF